MELDSDNHIFHIESCDLVYEWDDIRVIEVIVIMPDFKGQEFRIVSKIQFREACRGWKSDVSIGELHYCREMCLTVFKHKMLERRTQREQITRI